MQFTCRNCGKEKPIWLGLGLCDDCRKEKNILLLPLIEKLQNLAKKWDKQTLQSQACADELRKLLK